MVTRDVRDQPQAASRALPDGGQSASASIRRLASRWRTRILGVRAAHAAGLQTIMVPDIVAPTDEIRGLCAAVMDSLHDVRRTALRLAPDPAAKSKPESPRYPTPSQGGVAGLCRSGNDSDRLTFIDCTSAPLATAEISRKSGLSPRCPSH